MVVGIKPDKESQEKMFLFLQTMAPLMTAGDRDGLGYAAMTDEGMYIERWLDPSESFKTRKIWSKKDQAILDDFKGSFRGGPSYNYLTEKPGNHRSPAFAVIMHARMATCEVALKNVHPFYRKGTALIHNGIIGNHADLKKITSTCDSEVILNSYLDNGVQKDINSFQAVAKELRGSYACGVLTKDDTGKDVMDLFRNGNPLHAVHVEELDALVICTSSFMVKDACTKLKWSHGTFVSMEDDNITRIDARTGGFLARAKFQSSSASSYHTHGDYSGEHGNWRNGNRGYKNSHSSHNSNGSSTSSNVSTAKELGTDGKKIDENTGVNEKKRPKQIEMQRIKKLGSPSMQVNINDFQSDVVASKLRH